MINFILMSSFIRLRHNTLQLAAGINGMATRRSSKSEGGLASANSALIPRSLLRGASLNADETVSIVHYIRVYGIYFKSKV
jgi:hypothetical protein